MLPRVQFLSDKRAYEIQLLPVPQDILEHILIGDPLLPPPKIPEKGQVFLLSLYFTE